MEIDEFFQNKFMEFLKKCLIAGVVPRNSCHFFLACLVLMVKIEQQLGRIMVNQNKLLLLQDITDQ